MVAKSAACWRWLAVLLAGALPALAFPEPALWWLAYVALVPWIALLRRAGTARRAALYGWVGGTGFIMAVSNWLLPSLNVFFVVITATLGLLYAPWGWLTWRLLHGTAGWRRSAAAFVLLPCTWVLTEIVRSAPQLGGPWGLLGASQWQVPPARDLASVGGVWLVSLVLVLVNTALAVVLSTAHARLAGLATLLAVTAAVSGVWAWVPRPRPTGTVTVAVVQPGVIHSPTDRFEREAALTAALAGRHLDLVAWGESSVGFNLDGDADLARRLSELSRTVRAPLLVNEDARRGSGDGIYKSSVLLGSSGPAGQHYDKMRLVPFGEYVPARWLLGWATKVGRAATVNRHRGSHPVVMDLAGRRVGPLICFESAFPDMSRVLAQRGAELIVVQSATSTFQDGWAPEQHASLAAMRAAETWRPVVHATLTGVSAAYDARGRQIGRRLGTSQRVAEVFTVPLAAGTSPYVRYGDWVPHLALAVVGASALAAAARGAARAVRRRR